MTLLSVFSSESAPGSCVAGRGPPLPLLSLPSLPFQASHPRLFLTTVSMTDRLGVAALPVSVSAVVSEQGVRSCELPAQGSGRRLVRLERLVHLLAELWRGCAEHGAAVHPARVSVGPGVGAGGSRALCRGS